MENLTRNLISEDWESETATDIAGIITIAIALVFALAFTLILALAITAIVTIIVPTYVEWTRNMISPPRQIQRMQQQEQQLRMDVCGNGD